MVNDRYTVSNLDGDKEVSKLNHPALETALGDTALVRVPYLKQSLSPAAGLLPVNH